METEKGILEKLKKFREQLGEFNTIFQTSWNNIMNFAGSEEARKDVTNVCYEGEPFSILRKHFGKDVEVIGTKVTEVLSGLRTLDMQLRLKGTAKTMRIKVVPKIVEKKGTLLEVLWEHHPSIGLTGPEIKSLRDINLGGINDEKLRNLIVLTIMSIPDLQKGGKLPEIFPKIGKSLKNLDMSIEKLESFLKEKEAEVPAVAEAVPKKPETILNFLLSRNKSTARFNEIKNNFGCKTDEDLINVLEKLHKNEVVRIEGKDFKPDFWPSIRKMKKETLRGLKITPHPKYRTI